MRLSYSDAWFRAITATPITLYIIVRADSECHLFCFEPRMTTKGYQKQVDCTVTLQRAETHYAIYASPSISLQAGLPAPAYLPSVASDRPTMTSMLITPDRPTTSSISSPASRPDMQSSAPRSRSTGDERTHHILQRGTGLHAANIDAEEGGPCIRELEAQVHSEHPGPRRPQPQVRWFVFEHGVRSDRAVPRYRAISSIQMRCPIASQGLSWREQGSRHLSLSRACLGIDGGPLVAIRGSRPTRDDSVVPAVRVGEPVRYAAEWSLSGAPSTYPCAMGAILYVCE